MSPKTLFFAVCITPLKVLRSHIGLSRTPHARVDLLNKRFCEQSHFVDTPPNYGWVLLLSAPIPADRSRLSGRAIINECLRLPRLTDRARQFVQFVHQLALPLTRATLANAPEEVRTLLHNVPTFRADTVVQCPAGPLAYPTTGVRLTGTKVKFVRHRTRLYNRLPRTDRMHRAQVRERQRLLGQYRQHGMVVRTMRTVYRTLHNVAHRLRLEAGYAAPASTS